MLHSQGLGKESGKVNLNAYQVSALDFEKNNQNVNQYKKIIFNVLRFWFFQNL